ncbi:T4SS efffector SepA family protein [Pseudophaeobacter sp.]|uniref:T4SS efffector SepA family protein n=1 Tax=Pseudophaeobacter sp. TaxID=1971739 RepID=UPI004058F6ED
MMPVIRISDATFVDLKNISTWLGADTPSKTIESLVREKMVALDLERDVDEDQIEVVAREGEATIFERTPGLTFTRILSATMEGKSLGKLNWAGLLIEMAKHVKARGFAADRLATELQIPTKPEAYEEEGYRFYPELGISVQGQSAQDAWKEVSRLADKHRIPVEVEFQWRENEKAQHPGRVGIIRAGK